MWPNTDDDDLRAEGRRQAADLIAPPYCALLADVERLESENVAMAAALTLLDGRTDWKPKAFPKADDRAAANVVVRDAINLAKRRTCAIVA